MSAPITDDNVYRPSREDQVEDQTTWTCTRSRRRRIENEERKRKARDDERGSWVGRSASTAGTEVVAVAAGTAAEEIEMNGGEIGDRYDRRGGERVRGGESTIGEAAIGTGTERRPVRGQKETVRSGSER